MATKLASKVLAYYYLRPSKPSQLYGMSKNAKSYAWVFTTNNPTELDIQRTNDTECIYLIYGKEVASTGTPHLQGYVRFKNQVRFSYVQERFPNSHLEIAKGSPESNVRYCSKEGDVFEKGRRPMSNSEKGESQKTAWKSYMEAAKEGRLDDIDEKVRIRYYRTFKEIAKDYMAKPADAEDVTGLWISGPAGCGKSRYARELAPDSYFKLCNKWWDGYQNETSVIIDDMDKKHDVLGHHLKLWADRYSFIGETKGGALFIRPQQIIVTSQYDIEDIWPDDETRDALNRRFKKCKFDKLKNTD